MYLSVCDHQVDWYCVNVGTYHVKKSRDPLVALTEDKVLQGWLLEADRIFVRSVSLAVGLDGLKKLAAHFEDCSELLKQAKVEWAAVAITGQFTEGPEHSRRAAALIKKSGIGTLQAQQLEVSCFQMLIHDWLPKNIDTCTARSSMCSA